MLSLRFAVLLLQVSLSLGNFFGGETQYLERGQQGVVACPALLAAGLTPSEVPVVYWYKGRISSDALPVIVKYKGITMPGYGVPEGMYNISNNLGLIINQVNESNADNYYCRLSPQRQAFQDASVPIEVIVSPDPDKFPVVSPCDKKPIPSMCETSTDQSTINLTCKVENTFPAVELQIWSLDGSNNMFQLKDAVIETERVTVLQGNLTEREFLRTNNTFTRTASIEVEVGIGFTIILCNSSGPVPGKGKSTLGVIRKEVPLAPTAQTTSHATNTVSTGMTTTKEERTTSSIETGDDHPTRQKRVTTYLWFALFFVCVLLIKCVLLIIFSRQVTQLKDQWLQRGIKRPAEQPGQEQTTQMLEIEV